MESAALPRGRTIGRRLLLGLVATAFAVSGASFLLDARFKTDTGLLRTLTRRVERGARDRRGREPAMPVRATTGEIDLRFIDADPTLPRRMFQVEWDGIWYLDESSIVDLAVGADDRVVLSIDGRVLLEEDLATGAATTHATVELSRGYHRLNVLYEQRGGAYSLTAGWVPSGQAVRPFDPDQLFPEMPAAGSVAMNRRLLGLRRASVALWMASGLGLVLFVAAPRVASAARRAGPGRVRLLGASLFVVAFCGYFANTLHFEPIVTGSRENVIFSADTVSVARAMSELTFGRNMRQHPLFSPVTSSLVRAVEVLTPLGGGRSVLAVVALIGAANCLLAFLLVCRLGSVWAGLGFAAIYSVLLGNLALFSVPETYALSTFSVLLYLWYAADLTRPMTSRRVAVLGLLAGCAGLLNPPLLSLVVVTLALVARDGLSGRALALGSLTVSVALITFIGVNVAIYGGEFYLNYATDQQRYGRLANFGSVEAIGTVLAGFFLYSVVSPLGNLTHHLTLSEAAGYLRSVSASVLLTAYTFLMVRALIRIARERDALMLGVLCWLATMTGFHVYFNPPGVMLYAVQVLPALLLVAARQFTSASVPSWQKIVVLATFIVMLTLRNVEAVYAPVEVAVRR